MFKISLLLSFLSEGLKAHGHCWHQLEGIVKFSSIFSAKLCCSFSRVFIDDRIKLCVMLWSFSGLKSAYRSNCRLEFWFELPQGIYLLTEHPVDRVQAIQRNQSRKGRGACWVLAVPMFLMIPATVLHRLHWLHWEAASTHFLNISSDISCSSSIKSPCPLSTTCPACLPCNASTQVHSDLSDNLNDWSECKLCPSSLALQRTLELLKSFRILWAFDFRASPLTRIPCHLQPCTTLSLYENFQICLLVGTLQNQRGIRTQDTVSGTEYIVNVLIQQKVDAVIPIEENDTLWNSQFHNQINLLI